MGGGIVEVTFRFWMALIGIRVNRTNVGSELMPLFRSHISFPCVLSHLWISLLNQSTQWSIYGLPLEYVNCLVMICQTVAWGNLLWRLERTEWLQRVCVLDAEKKVKYFNLGGSKYFTYLQSPHTGLVGGYKSGLKPKTFYGRFFIL